MNHTTTTSIAFSLMLFVLFFLGSPVQAATQLNVPFTSQAPDGIWIQPWKDACEETSVFMVHRFYLQKNIETAEDAKRGIFKNFNMKKTIHGTSLDENARTIVNTINTFLPWSAHVVDDPTLADMKAELADGRPIIVPAYAPALHNENFGGPFPYHMIVLSGYDDTDGVFITEDPGTQYGHSYRYTYATILDAMHDFLSGDVANGPKRAIFTNPDMGETALLDGDRDGLSKTEEFQHGTVPYLYDSDGDGYGDGLEVNTGYFPTKNEPALIKEGVLVISTGSPNIYVIHKGQKRHVSNEGVFTAHGWQGSLLEWISDAMMKTIPEGTPLTS